MLLPWKNNYTVALRTEEEDGIQYVGPSILKEFEILDLFCNSSIVDDGSVFNFTIRMRRVGFSAINGIFIQTFLLWFLVYLTLFIDAQDFNNRFMGALTGFLVLAALTPTIMNMVPPASYFKLIDLWSMFFIGNIASIILSHIGIDFLIKNPGRFQKRSSNSRYEVRLQNLGLVANNLAKIFYPIITVCFVIIYIKQI